MSIAHHLFSSRYGGWWMVLLVLLAYWPVSTFQHSLSAGDTLDCWLPWRFFLSATMQDGALPAWNPYQQMGYPVHADLQGPAWYPEALLIGGTIGHSTYTLSLLFLAYVIIGGLGMRHLVMQMGLEALPAFLAGVAYSLSGFFTGHAMHFYAVISAAWLPWLCWSALRLLDDPSARNALIASVFLFFLLTGGNHTFLIIASYPLLALGLSALFHTWKREGRCQATRVLCATGLMVATAFVLSIGTFHALLEVGPYMDRSQGMTLEAAAVDPFTPRAARSLLLPWLATLDPAELGTDMTMANGYFGALMLPFVVVGMLRHRGVRERIFLVTAVLAALASFGSALPVHEWLWRYLPGMDLFRFPAYFHFFVMFCVLPIAARGFSEVMLKGRLKTLYLTVLALSASIVGAMLFSAEWAGWPAVELPVMECINGTAVGTRIVVNGCIALVFFGIAFAAVRRRPQPRLMASSIVLELLIAVQFTQWGTALATVSPSAIQWRIDAQPVGPTVPELLPMATSRDGSQIMHHLWRNTQVFRGVPTHDGFNSFWLSDHLELESEHPDLFRAMQGMPMVYLARAVLNDPKEVELVEDGAVALITDPALLSGVRPAAPGDRVSLMSFDHNSMGLNVAVRNKAFIVFQQNNYPGWEVLVDGEPVAVHSANIAAFGAVVPAGEHILEVRYHKPVLVWLRWISFVAFMLILFILAWTAPNGRFAWLVGASFVLLGFLWSYHGHRPKALRIMDEWPGLAKDLSAYPGIPVVLNTDRPWSVGPGPWTTVRVDRPDHTEALDVAFASTDSDSAWCAWAGLPFTPAMRVWAMDRFGPPRSCSGNEDAGAWLMVKDASVVQAAEVLFRDLGGDGMTLVDPASPYSTAFRVPVKELRSDHGDHLVIDVRFKAGEGALGRVVLERKCDERNTAYEAVPFGEDDTEGQWRSVYIVRPMGLLGADQEELGIYLWNASSEPLMVSDLRVRTICLGEPSP
ncbi:MAG: hypothetical protein KDC00_01525 [Flavobacteriales bacterium]|nr:hypothetical protein [Flavobacteriales bacterium]